MTIVIFLLPQHIRVSLVSKVYEKLEREINDLERDVLYILLFLRKNFLTLSPKELNSMKKLKKVLKHLTQSSSLFPTSHKN
ncbi:hypothetical protein LguiA_030500 [Lonicera macranthoides]